MDGRRRQSEGLKGKGNGREAWPGAHIVGNLPFRIRISDGCTLSNISEKINGNIWATEGASFRKDISDKAQLWGDST
jgi:hypothetical protein